MRTSGAKCEQINFNTRYFQFSSAGVEETEGRHSGMDEGNICTQKQRRE